MTPLSEYDSIAIAAVDSVCRLEMLTGSSTIPDLAVRVADLLNANVDQAHHVFCTLSKNDRTWLDTNDRRCEPWRMNRLSLFA